MSRVIIAANALWILLSRWDLTTLVGWPAPFWAGVGALRIRYFIFLPQFAERALYVVACIALVAVLCNIATRVAALAAGLLLYHFAPFENLISAHIGPYFNGLTLPTLALLIIAFAPPPANERSSDNRWPLALIQLLFSFTYLLAGLSKLRYSGLHWISGDNMRSTIEVFNAFEPAHRPLATWFIAHPTVCSAIVIATILLEVSFVMIFIKPRLSHVVVPLLVVGHIGIYLTLGVMFLNLPLVAMFWDWE